MYDIIRDMYKTYDYKKNNPVIFFHYHHINHREQNEERKESFTNVTDSSRSPSLTLRLAPNVILRDSIKKMEHKYLLESGGRRSAIGARLESVALTKDSVVLAKNPDGNNNNNNTSLKIILGTSTISLSFYLVYFFMKKYRT